METLSYILMIIGGGLLLWFSYTTIKRHPGAFRAENINKSIFTLGLLALFLIVVITVLVMLLKH